MIVDYNKAQESGYEVVELDPNIHIIKDFISNEDGKFLLDFAASLSEDAWTEQFLSSLKMKCLQEFGSDDLDKLERDGLIVQDKRYQYDKSIALAYGRGLEGQLSTVTDRGYSICEGMTQKLSSLISDGYELFPFNSMRRHYPGDGMVDHTDQKDTPNQRQSCVLYLNNDYSGGELYFRDQGIEVRPDPCSLVIFNNGIDYMHGVRTVLPGKTRYTMATFISKIV